MTRAGFVTFELQGRAYAAPLEQVQEVIRLAGLTSLPGMAAPVTGVVELRGRALPVVDLRPKKDGAGRGDVLVLGADDGTATGLAVDRVLAVLDEADLVVTDEGASRRGLPAYVREVRRSPLGLVFVVDALRMLAARPARVRTARAATSP